MTTADDVAVFYELAQAKAQYCRLLDTKDWSALAEIFTPDVIFDLSDGAPGAEPVVGRDNVIETVKASVTSARTAHQVHMPEIEIDGEAARVVWAVQERVIWENGTSLTAYGHYRDRWVRDAGRWKLAELRLSHLIMDFA